MNGVICVNICPKCHVLCIDECPKCGNRRKLRAAEADEPVLLIVMTAMLALVVEPILADSGIPYYKKGEFGGALTAQAGMMREIYHFYVSCSDYERGRDVIEGTFGEDEEIMKLLHEFDVLETGKGE